MCVIFNDLSLSIKTYLLASLGNMKAHSRMSGFLFATKAAWWVCCCAWGHFECGALPAGPRGPPPCPTVPLDCCCTLVSTEGMNIFLNFADSITLSLTILSLGGRHRDNKPSVRLTTTAWVSRIQGMFTCLSRMFSMGGITSGPIWTLPMPEV